tara:strand:+ start:2217 stop:2573 length:357 start_codon:yes stop_codon:yes gene_type:complete
MSILSSLACLPDLEETPNQLFLDRWWGIVEAPSFLEPMFNDCFILQGEDMFGGTFLAYREDELYSYIWHMGEWEYTSIVNIYRIDKQIDIAVYPEDDGCWGVVHGMMEATVCSCQYGI